MTRDALGDEKVRDMISPARILPVITTLALVLGIGMALAYAETDQQGQVQRLFYVHMSAFFGALLSFGVTVYASVRYLRSRDARWDALAVAGVEVGLLLAIINLVTGSIWARPIWATWWNWDPRLTWDAIMVLTYAAYVILRGAIEQLETRRRFAAIYGILAIFTAIMTLIIIRIRPDTLHPAVVGPSAQEARGSFEASASMQITLLVNLIVWGVLLPITLLPWRYRLQRVSEQLARMRQQWISGA